MISIEVNKILIAAGRVNKYQFKAEFTYKDISLLPTRAPRGMGWDVKNRPMG